MSQINLLLDALIECQEGMDARTFWPCHAAQVEAYFSDLIAWNLLTKFRQNQAKFEKAINTVGVDILRFHLLSSGLVGLKVIRKYGPGDATTREIIAFVGALLNSIKRRTNSDPFCRNGENKIMTTKVFEKKLTSHVFIPFANLEQKRILTEFNISAEALTWALYFDLYRDAGMVIHGGYAVPSGKVIVRDFFDLGQAPSASTLLLYDNGFHYVFDFANHIVYEDNHLEHLKGYLVLVDGKQATIEETLALEENFSNLRQKLVAKTNKLSPAELIWQGAVNYWNLFQNFFGYYKESFAPPAEVKNRIADWGLKYWERFKPTNKKVPLNYIRRLYDPQNDFLG